MTGLEKIKLSPLITTVNHNVHGSENIVNQNFSAITGGKKNENVGKIREKKY